MWCAISIPDTNGAPGGAPLVKITNGVLLMAHHICAINSHNRCAISRGFSSSGCFSYCSLFPEDYRFNGGILVYALISQSFVQCEDPMIRLEETGHKYLDRLVDLGFFQKDGSQYVMHDLMHELAGTVSSNECATVHGLKPGSIQRSVRHLSIITTAFDKDENINFPGERFDKILQKVGPLQKLRTLMLFGRSSIHLLGSIRTLCKEAKCLRFLRIYVTGADISSINSLLNPCHLRYLEYVCVRTMNVFTYGGTRNIFVNGVDSNTALPQALTQLYHLQVLDVGISNNLAVPTDMHNLVNLRHLISHEEVHHAIACVGNMTSLQELRFNVQNAGSFEVKQLQSMDELVQLKISQLQNVKTKEEAIRARLLNKEYLETLSLSWEDNSTSLQPNAAKDVLEGLQPHQDLKTLEITRYGGATSPTWLSSNLSVTSLQILHLENCMEWKILRSIEMPSLRKLTLIRMLNLMEILVPSLEELTLIDMPKLEKCIGSYGMELTSSLRVLIMKNFPQLNEFTLFQSYSSFDAEQKSWFTSLSKLSIGQCPHIMNNWPILPLREMRALKELELMDLHVLRVSVPSLEKLVLTKMPILEFCGSLTTSPPMQFLPSQGDQKEWTSNLRRLTIHDCPCLIVSHPLPPSGLISELSIRGVPTLPTMSMLQRHFIIKSNELSVLDDSILAFHNLRGITSFRICNYPNLVSLPSEAFSQLIALERLAIFNCPNLTMSSTMPEVLMGNSRSASSLVLPSLKKLIIVRCGVTGRWITQMLSHSQPLEELELTDCPQIKFLSISQPREMEGTSSFGSTVMTSTQDEQELKLPCNLLCSLRTLWIQDSLDLEFSGNNREIAGFTSLRGLMLHDCPKLVSSLVGETKDDGTVEAGLLPPSLQDLSIRPLPENLQSFTPQGLLHLKKLSLSNGPCLKSVQLHSCTALKKLKITGCVQLAVLEGMQFLTSLRSLDIDLNPELSCAWDLKLEEQEQCGNQIQLFPSSLEELKIQKLTDRVQSRLLSCLPAITKIAIQESPGLTSLQLGCCTALKELEIERCSSLASIEGLQFYRNLTSLKVLNSHGLGSCLELVSHQQGASGIWSGLETLKIDDASVLSMPFCKQLTSLTHLQLRSWGLVCLTEGQETTLKLLTSLHELEFSSSVEFSSQGLVSLTEEQETTLQLLTSLQKLEFSLCKDLLSLPANLHRLTSLQMLYLHGCQSITTLPDMGLPHSLTYH